MNNNNINSNPKNWTPQFTPAATSSLNTQIYNSRVHSLQQLQLQEQYTLNYQYQRYAFQQQQQQQQAQVQGQIDQYPNYPYAYSYNNYSQQQQQQEQPHQALPLAQRQINTISNLQYRNRRNQPKLTNNITTKVSTKNNNPITNNSNNDHHHIAIHTNAKHNNNNNNIKEIDILNDSITNKEIVLTDFHKINFENDQDIKDYSEILKTLSVGDKVRSIINKIPRRIHNNNNNSNNHNSNYYKNTYKLKNPLLKSMTKTQSNVTLLINEIDSTYKLENNLSQPLLLGGNQTFKVNSINEFSPKLFETFINRSKTNSTTGSNINSNMKPRQLQLKSNASAIFNESFDLSFDGKALDRSDIFRMVDSFSIAFSDNDDSNMQNTESEIIQENDNKDERNGPNDTTNENNIESTKNDLQINESDLVDASSSNEIGITDNESSFIVNPTKNILPAEITSGNPIY